LSLYRVVVGRDEYLGTPEEVVGWMSRAEGAPAGGPEAYMRGIAARVGERSRGVRIDVSEPLAFLESLSSAGLLRLEARGEPSSERVDPRAAVGKGPVALGADVDPDDLEHLLGEEK
jgi:hypothetical protein